MGGLLGPPIFQSIVAHPVASWRVLSGRVASRPVGPVWSRRGTLVVSSRVPSWPGPSGPVTSMARHVGLVGSRLVQSWLVSLVPSCHVSSGPV